MKGYATGHPLDVETITRLARLAVEEDLAGGIDLTTTSTVPSDQISTADLIARTGGIVAGLPIAQAVFTLCGVNQCDALVEDGSQIAAGDVVLTATGPTRSLLTAERSALNVVNRLSGVATLTAAWVHALAGTGAVVRDTRKTTPGLRAAEKYAVRCGGGQNHRMGLFDQALIKDNHLVAAGGVAPAIRAVRAAHPDVVCEVECDTLDQVSEALAEGAVLVLLDNMDVGTMHAAVQLARAVGAQTEASGNLSLDRARQIAETGVDFLAVGALTHSAPALDLGLDLRLG
jgi:nicotinate-nucleotide pyrophosphorylase (carboxylating)